MRLAHHLLTWTSDGSTLDVAAAFRAIAAAGYAGVELLGGRRLLGTPAEVRDRLEETGLVAVAHSCGVALRPSAEDARAWRAEMDDAAELGIRTITVCGGFPGGPRRTAFDDEYEAFAGNLAAAGRHAEANGQVLAFHPHLGCIVETAAEIERLLDFAPTLRLCLDTGHLAAAREDPSALARRYADRLAHTHLKDWSAADNFFTELGQGDAGLDFGAYLRTLDDVGYTGWLVVERDAPRLPPAESARLSRRHLAGLPSAAP